MFGEKPMSRTKIQILKVRAGQAVHVQVRGEEPLAFHIHWLETRSLTCPGKDCPACLASMGSRWVGFLPVSWWDAKQTQKYSGALELTESCYERLVGLLRMEGRPGLLGLQLIASRRTNRSPLRLEPVGSSEMIETDCKQVPMTIMADAVATLWQLPACPSGMKFVVWEEKAMQRARALLAVAVPKVLCSTA